MTRATVQPTIRRRLGATALIAVVALVVTACSGGGSSAPSDLAEVLARFDETGIVCDGKVEPYVRGENAADLGVDPTETFKCTVGGVRVQGTQYESESHRSIALDASTALVCNAGGKPFTYVADGPWMITAEDPSTRTSDTELLGRIADATDATRTTTTCPDATEGTHGQTPDGAATTGTP